MQMIPYLTFDGRCAEAFRFYQSLLGGTIEMMQDHGTSPIAGDIPADWHDRILHACLVVGDEMLMGSDSPPGRHEAPRGMHVTLQIDDIERAERVFDALSKDGMVQMPFAETFWAARFGMLVDRFGIPWMINCARPD